MDTGDEIIDTRRLTQEERDAITASVERLIRTAIGLNKANAECSSASSAYLTLLNSL